jgi:hypothetical protein
VKGKMEEAKDQTADEQPMSIAEIIKGLAPVRTAPGRSYRRPLYRSGDSYYPPPDGIDDYGTTPPDPPTACTPDKFVNVRLSLYHLWWIEWRLRIHVNSYSRVEWPAMKKAVTEAIEILQQALSHPGGPDLDLLKVEQATKDHHEALNEYRTSNP